MSSPNRWPTVRALRMRHSIFMLCTATLGLAALAFSFGWRGFTALRGIAARADATSAAGHADLAIAASLTLAIVFGLLGLHVVLLRRYERLRARIEPIRAAAGAYRAPDLQVWEQRLHAELVRSRRLGYPLTVAVLDLDDRATGTEHPIAEFEQAISNALRATDTVTHCELGRFALLLPSCPPEQTSALLERLREAAPAGQTFAAGIAAWHWRETGIELVERAHRALQVARNDERKPVAVSPSPPPNVDRPAHRRVAQVAAEAQIE